MIEFKNVSKKYGNQLIIDDLSLKINKGEIITLIGESGCGKTTTLKMINRLIPYTSGTIIVDGNNIMDVNVVELRRQIGYVIQQTGLFPHMTVRENIELIPKILKRDKSEIVKKTLELMELVGLDPDRFLDRYPLELSGGQQQRVGVARAFAIDPDIILMDEPFSALDPITREQLQDELLFLQSTMQKTIVFVTHDMDEAIKLSDKICIMDKGKIKQFDTPEIILRHPIDEFVENFIGRKRIWSSPEFIKVKTIMIEKPVTAASFVSVFKGMEIMKSSKVDSLVVINEKKHVLGVVTAKYLQTLSEIKKPLNQIIEWPTITISHDASIVDALELIEKEKISHLPVINQENELVGIITYSNLISVLSQQFVNVEVA